MTSEKIALIIFAVFALIGFIGWYIEIEKHNQHVNRIKKEQRETAFRLMNMLDRSGTLIRRVRAYLAGDEFEPNGELCEANKIIEQAEKINLEIYYEIRTKLW